MDAHLSEESRESGNRRNGKMSKRVQTQYGEVTVETPRDRDGSFDPQTVRKRELSEKKDVRHRIVSIDRPYIRPIVRGKENKRVEFGARVNNIQIGGISFIEHHSFEAFNEGARLK